MDNILRFLVHTSIVAQTRVRRIEFHNEKEAIFTESYVLIAFGIFVLLTMCIPNKLDSTNTSKARNNTTICSTQHIVLSC